MENKGKQNMLDTLVYYFVCLIIGHHPKEVMVDLVSNLYQYVFNNWDEDSKDRIFKYGRPERFVYIVKEGKEIILFDRENLRLAKNLISFRINVNLYREMKEHYVPLILNTLLSVGNTLADIKNFHNMGRIPEMMQYATIGWNMKDVGVHKPLYANFPYKFTEEFFETLVNQVMAQVPVEYADAIPKIVQAYSDQIIVGRGYKMGEEITVPHNALGTSYVILTHRTKPDKRLYLFTQEFVDMMSGEGKGVMNIFTTYQEVNPGSNWRNSLYTTYGKNGKAPKGEVQYSGKKIKLAGSNTATLN